MTTTDATATITELELAGAPPIPGLRFRRPRAGDMTEFDGMAAVAAAANQADGLDWIPTGEHLRDDLEKSAGTDLLSDVVVAELDGRIIAWGSTERSIRDGLVVFETWGSVHPEQRRRGIGRTIFDENLRRARDRGREEPADATVVGQTMVDQDQAGNLRLVEAAGFEAVRWFFLMRRPDLEDIPETTLPDGIELRPVQPDQHRAIIAAEDEAFRDHWGSRGMTEEDFQITFGRRQLDTDLWVVAWDGDEVAGVVQNWIWPEENETLGVQRGWLEHISVRRPWRRRGLARAITAESLLRLRAAGMRDAMLGVDADNPNGALGLYQSLGFVVHHQATTYRRSLRD